MAVGEMIARTVIVDKRYMYNAAIRRWHDADFAGLIAGNRTHRSIDEIGFFRHYGCSLPLTSKLLTVACSINEWAAMIRSGVQANGVWTIFKRLALR